MRALRRGLGALYLAAAAVCAGWLLWSPASGWLTAAALERAGLNDYRDLVSSVQAAYWEERDLVVLCLRGRLEESGKESDYSLRVPVPLVVSDPAGAADAGFEPMQGLDGLGWYLPRSHLGPPCSPAIVNGMVPAERLEVRRARAGLANYYLDNKRVRSLRVTPPDRAAVAEVTVSSGGGGQDVRLALVTTEPNAAGSYATGVETLGAVRRGNPAWRWLVPLAVVADGLAWPAQVALHFDLLPAL